MKPEIKAAVFSDTHGAIAYMREAITAYRPDVVIHLGDYVRDVDKLKPDFPLCAFYNVSGNNDMFASAPRVDTVQLGPVKAFICHGHTYNVEWGDTSRLVYAAMEQGAQLALYGHTHRTDNSEFGGVKIVNPGTAGRGRTLTWAAVEVYENGGITVEIKSFK